MKVKFILLMFMLTFVSCSTIYYKTWEALGREKRDLLKSKMEDAYDSQEDIEGQFKDSLDRVRKRYSFSEGRLEKAYDSLRSDYEDLNEEAQEYFKEIDEAQEIAEDLFDEWKREARELGNKTYRRQSFSKLAKTKTRFYKTINKMKKIERSTSVVLKRYKDQVIFLKHNLNAKIIGQVEGEINLIESDVSALLKEIKRSSTDAKSFIESLN